MAFQERDPGRRLVSTMGRSWGLEVGGIFLLRGECRGNGSSGTKGSKGRCEEEGEGPGGGGGSAGEEAGEAEQEWGGKPVHAEQQTGAREGTRGSEKQRVVVH